MNHSIAFMIGILSFTVLISRGQVIYVSTHGDDKNPGTKEKPVAGFHRAQQLARNATGERAVEVIFKSGIYYLPQTIQFTAADNNQKGVLYQAEKEGTVVFSGGKRLYLTWKPYRNRILVAAVPAGIIIDQLFVNGDRQRMARFPNAKAGKKVFDTWDLGEKPQKDSLQDALLPSRIAGWQNPAGAYLHAMHNSLWGDMHWLIKGKDAKGQLEMEGGWQNNRPAPMHPVYRMIENVFEELDTPGEWFYNTGERKLYYMPEAGMDMQKASIEVVRLKHLVEFNGTADQPVKNIRLNGFVFKHTARTFMENREPLLRSDWTVYRGGAIVFNGATNCAITNSEFDHVGGNTIFVNNYNRNITIKGCYIHHSGASGILFVGDTASVRSPLYGYTTRDYATMDTLKGPRSNNYPADCLVEDCLITLTGRDEKQTAGIQISMSAGIHINHCSIYDMPRAGINISEGCFGGHIIENSEIFNTVLETGDHGSFNSWGRDRYWTIDANEVNQVVKKNPSLPFLDMVAPIIIRHNRWRCDYGWDIDLDDGSTGYLIYNNVLLNSGLKLREGYNRIVTNNIILNNSLHPHVWFQNSGDVFTHNIVFAAYKPAVMNKTIPENGKWGQRIDSNLFVCDSGQMRRYSKNDCDAHSVTGDPLFKDAATGDYTVKENSPAISMGFSNFSMDDFGVAKPALRKIARHPRLPVINIQLSGGNTGNEKVFMWMDATLTEPKGGEHSAYGIGYNEGGIAFKSIEAKSVLKKAGFQTGDIIQLVNGSKVNTISDLKKFINSQKNINGKYLFGILRNQQKITIEYNGKLAFIEN